MSERLLDGYLHAAVLQREIDILRSRLQPHDTGHLHTAINVLEQRILELIDHRDPLPDEAEHGADGR
jgi:hypothetical protein